MNIPLDNLYHWIADQFPDALIYRFFPNGSKKIHDLQLVDDRYDKRSWLQMHWNVPIICHDQEPLNYDLYRNLDWRDIPKYRPSIIDDKNERVWHLHATRNLAAGLSSIFDKVILLHSELQSVEISKYEDIAVPAYWWSHALIARDWYRYAEHDRQLQHKNQYQYDFNIYARSYKGSREYRKFFLFQCIEKNLLPNCRISCNPPDSDYKFKYPQFDLPIMPITFESDIIHADSSATYSIKHYASCWIDVVLETVMESQRIHLTEKILRPLACGKPFLLAAGPGSLDVLKSYGFKTFSPIINESYDLINDPIHRMHAIIAEMQKLSQMPLSRKNAMATELNKICDFNRKHFFHNQFVRKIISELATNILEAQSTVLENYATGKNWWAVRKATSRSDKRRLLDKEQDRFDSTIKILRYIRQQRQRSIT
jgi:hypothetical protein